MHFWGGGGSPNKKKHKSRMFFVGVGRVTKEVYVAGHSIFNFCFPRASYAKKKVHASYTKKKIIDLCLIRLRTMKKLRLGLAGHNGQ